MVWNLSIGIGPCFLVSISGISGVNIGHVGNIGSDSSRYYSVNIVLGISNFDMILPIFETMLCMKHMSGHHYILILPMTTTSHHNHGSQSRTRPPTRRALRRIGLGDLNRSRAIRAKRYIESLKNSEKITINLKKCRHAHLCIICPKHIT